MRCSLGLEPQEERSFEQFTEFERLQYDPIQMRPMVEDSQANYQIEPMTLGNMGADGVRSLDLPSSCVRWA